MQVKVLVSAYHAGWFEFRLAKPKGCMQAYETNINCVHVLLQNRVPWAGAGPRGRHAEHRATAGPAAHGPR